MTALVYDRSLDPWETSRGLRKVEVATPGLDRPEDRSSVIIRVLYAGFCGTDRGIWHRRAFRDMILNSLDEEQGDRRITGHELLGEIVQVAPGASDKYGFEVGDIVSTESHIICGTCRQCMDGDTHVCARDRIIGLSQDGCFADYIKLPAKALWPTDLDRIRPEVAACQEPFGNAVHACTKVDLRGKSVAIFGTGTIGLFAVLVARGLGAGRIVAIEPDARHADMARRLGADHVIEPEQLGSDKLGPNRELVDAVQAAFDSDGPDVSMEMSGFNTALNNAIACTRRGGDVILFGIKDGDFVIRDYGRLVMNGLALHAVVGRRIFETWKITRSLLEDANNGIQERIWDVILNRGEGAVVDIRDWDFDSFERVIAEHPKPLLRFGGAPLHT